MRKLAILIAATLPMAAHAEQTVIRIEAKRGDQAQIDQTIQGWAAKFPDVVTFAAPGGWTAIALGPMERDAAEARLTELKAARTIPADSFVSPAGEVTPVTSTVATAPAPDAQTPAAPANPGSTFPADPAATTAPVETTETAPDPTAGQGSAEPGDQSPPADAQVEPTEPDTAAAAPQPQAAEPDPATHYIRLVSFKTRAEGDAALAEWRQKYPEVALNELPNGWFGVTLGPLRPEVADAWLKAFKTAKLAPRGAFVAGGDMVGTPVVRGTTPELPPAGSAEMPPLDQVQRALRWAGYYTGPIDGKDGPQTQDAIAAEVVGDRAAPDAGTAMVRLMERRSAWQADMALTKLDDAHTGLSVTAPMDRLEFDRADRALSIYRPKDDSGAALILFSAPGGQEEMLDLTGLVTALGWVPSPERKIARGSAILDGRNATHIGHAEARVADGRAEGFVLIWPVEDAENQPRIAAEISDSLTRYAPAQNDTVSAEAGNPLVPTDSDAAETDGAPTE